MKNKFLDGLAEETNWKLTENQADALESTTDSLLDLFGTIGALRTRSDKDIEVAFMKAYHEDNLLALKMLFYARNIRGGLGERRVFRIILKWLAERDPKHIIVNFGNIAKFGRWDDFYAFVDTPIEEEAFEYLLTQFSSDLTLLNYKDKHDSLPISLLGKWLKSANSKCKETRRLGLLTVKHFGMTEKEYRQALSKLRKHIKVTETLMSSKRWSEIEYSHVPSLAMTKYRNAFRKQDEERFLEYLEKVKAGETKISATTLYPYNLVEKYLYGNRQNYWYRDKVTSLDTVIEAQWKALPNYVEGEHNFMVIADVSGSMSGRPMATSVGLAIYFAERNRGPYHNKFMTFSKNPQYVDLKGQTLCDNINQAVNASWGWNTDIEAAFNLVLKVAVDNELPQEDLPKSLIIISDMEFDQAQDSYSGRKTYHTHMTEKYAAAGYELPAVVYWNVDARQDTFHAKAETPGVQFISGQSVTAFKSLIKGASYTAYELMLDTLNDEIYDSVVLR